jgi:hypothetical protein
MHIKYYLPIAALLVAGILLAAGGLAVLANTGDQGQDSIFAPLVISNISVKGAASCFNALINSEFESETGWEIPITAYSAGYSTAQAHSGTRSMRTGITVEADNRFSYSDARQVVTIPATAASVTLRMWVYPVSTESTTFLLPETAEGMSFGDSPMANDVQYVIILNQYGTWIDTLLWQRSNSKSWTEHIFDLTAYRGRTIKIQFGTYNDGFDGFTAMYVDDAYLDVCTTSLPTPSPTRPTPTSTATPTPTATVTPPPAGCYEAVANGGFETVSSWYLPITVYSASYSSAQAHSGSWSLRTGIINPADNRYSYSSGQQTITIPATPDQAILRFWAYQSTGETPSSLLEDLPPILEGFTFTDQGFGDGIMAGDVQYALILDTANKWIGTLLWQRKDTGAWTEYIYDISAFAGRTIKLHFGTYNDGWNGVTSMYIDDVSLQICPSEPVPTPTITPTPTATPPGVCSNILDNSSFEVTGSWLIPITEYSAGYTSILAHTGERSMRTGILTAADNRYSYSDAWQAAFIPYSASSATLRVWAYQSTSESPLGMLPDTQEGIMFGESILAGDVQYVLILDRYGTWIDTLLWKRSQTGAWTEYTYDLTAYRGWLIRLHFGTYNDGLGGITSMHIDDMTLEICP